MSRAERVFTSLMHPDEAAALALVSERLGRRFPGRSPQEIDVAVARAHREYDDRPVRTFVPILVEREVADLLRSSRAAPLADAL